MGIEIDTHGNIIVATSEDTSAGVMCFLEIFSPTEKHLQSHYIQGIKPSGICLYGKCLYLAEILSKRIEILTLYDKSVL